MLNILTYENFDTVAPPLVAGLYNSAADYDRQEQLYWRDVLEHSCNIDGGEKKKIGLITEFFISFFFSCPVFSCQKYENENFREVIGSYAAKVRKLSKLILGLLSEGLGFGAGYFDNDLGQTIVTNHYPKCPEPSITLGSELVDIVILIS